MKNILIPIDFSPVSEMALEFAANLASKTASSIHLLHVLEIAPSFSMNLGLSGDFFSGNTDTIDDVPYMMALLKDVKAKMKSIKAKPWFKNITVNDIIKVGPVANEIVAASKEYKADLIVMGSHGASGMNEYFIGSNAEKVVRMVNCKVITIKHKIKDINIKNIVFATDLSLESYELYDEIRDFADIYKADIHLLKVNTLKNFTPTRIDNMDIAKFAKKSGVDINSISVYNDEVKESGILHFADDIKADLIAIASHGRSGLSMLFNKSISSDLVNHSFLPVLTLNFFGKK